MCELAPLSRRAEQPAQATTKTRRFTGGFFRERFRGTRRVPGRLYERNSLTSSPISCAGTVLT